MLTRFGGDVQKALDSYQELDSTFGREGHRLGQQVSELQEQLAQMQAERLPDEGQDAGGSALPDMNMEDLQGWFEENPAQATAYLIAQGQQMLLGQIEQTLDQRLRPLESTVGQSTATSMYENLGKALGGDVVHRNIQTLLDLKETDPELFRGDPQIVFNRMKTAVLAAEATRPGRGAPNGAAPTPQPGVAIEGGSGGRNPNSAPEGDTDPVAAFLAEMNAKNVKLDIFGREVPA